METIHHSNNMICTKFTRKKKSVNFPKIWDFPCFFPGQKTQVFCNLSFGCGSCRSNLEERCQNRSPKIFARKMLAFFCSKYVPDIFVHTNVDNGKLKIFSKDLDQTILEYPLPFPSLGFAFPHQFSSLFLGWGSGWRYPVACVSLHIAASSWPPSASSHPSPGPPRERTMDSGNRGPWRCCYSYVWWMLHICFPCIKCLWLLRTKIVPKNRWMP